MLTDVRRAAFRQPGEEICEQPEERGCCAYLPICCGTPSRNRSRRPKIQRRVAGNCHLREKPMH
jgi:hypothetical protein